MKNMKVISLLLVSLFVLCTVSSSIGASIIYKDFYWNGSYANATDTSISYHYLKNNTPVMRWSRNISTTAVAIDNKAVYAMGKNKILFALNKTKGATLWNLTLNKTYTKAQFVTKKYLVLSSTTATAMISLNNKTVKWNRTYTMSNLLFYGAIKAKNGSYYLMLKNNSTTRFYKLPV